MEQKRSKLVFFWTISILILFCLGVIFLYFFFKSKTSAPQDADVSETCLVFQDADRSKPCFRPSNQPPNTAVIPPAPIELPKKTDLPASVVSAVSSCNSPISIEKDDCIKKVAVQTKNKTICSALSGASDEKDCNTLVTRGEERPVNVFQQVIANYIFPTTSVATINRPVQISSTFNDALNKLRTSIEDAKNNPDSRFTADGFFERLRSSPLQLFSFSDFQVSPGAQTTANGFGFTKTGNDIHIGNYTVPNLPSVDGLTIKLTLPTGMPEGMYEIWATNEKGSSRKSNQPIQIKITNNPAPRPVITSVSPLTPTLADTVTLSGQSLAGAIGVFTSLGVSKNVSSGDSSITFKISDLSAVDKIKDLPYIKGKKINVSVIIATPQGYNKDIFNFDVQF